MLVNPHLHHCLSTYFQLPLSFISFFNPTDSKARVQAILGLEKVNLTIVHYETTLQCRPTLVSLNTNKSISAPYTKAKYSWREIPIFPFARGPYSPISTTTPSWYNCAYARSNLWLPSFRFVKECPSPIRSFILRARFIAINKCSLPITTNLYSALQHLRDPLLKRSLWIDAICINQEDKGERRLQVQFMAMIYTMASHVTVWLGEATTNGERALQEIHRAAYSNEQPTENDPVVQNAVLELLQQPWFKRVWVCKEFSCSILILF